jgi:hypothetical protein
VKETRKGPSNARVDYRWRVDRDEGFEKTSMIYGRDGRLVGIDYETTSRAEPGAAAPRETPPRERR